MDSFDSQLEWSGSEFRAHITAALEHIARHIDSLAEQPAWGEGADAAAIRREFRQPMPATGRPLEEVLSDLFGRYLEPTFNTASPGYLAFIPGGGILHAALADLIADSINRYVGVWNAAPWLAQIEVAVTRWLCQMVGLPESAGGFLTTGGSLAGWSALAAALAGKENQDRARLIVYSSNQWHHCLPKALRLLGIPDENVRLIGVDAEFRIDVGQLDERIVQDRRDGWIPWVVVGQAGTTNTGAVDDLAALAELCRRESIWFHADAAYGGFFCLTEHGKSRLQGIEQADSVVLDPHKGMFLPYGTGSVLVRDVNSLRAAHSLTSDYMPELQQDLESWDVCEISPELSRDFRALRVWLPLQLAGVDAFRNNLHEKVQLINYAQRELERINERHGGELEFVARPQLTVLAFRWHKPGCSNEELDDLNQALVQKINAPRRVFLTPTRVDGKFVIRICILSFRTHRDRVDECLQIVDSALAELRK